MDELANHMKFTVHQRSFREKPQGNYVNKDSDNNFILPLKKQKEYINLK